MATDLREIHGELTARINTEQTAFNPESFCSKHQLSAEAWTRLSEHVYLAACVSHTSQGKLDDAGKKQLLLLAQILKLDNNQVKTLVTKGSQVASEKRATTTDTVGAAAEDTAITPAEHIPSAAGIPMQGTGDAWSLDAISAALGQIDRSPIAEQAATTLKNSLAAMFESIPGDDLSFMEKRLVVRQSVAVPVLAAEVHSLYESRSSEETSQPFVQQPVPERVITPQNVQPWSYDFTPSTSFSDEDTQHSVVDSRHVETCGTCTGTTRVTCYTCKGSCQDTCQTCKGQTKVTCPTCSGAAQVNQPITESYIDTCGNCGGAGGADTPYGFFPCVRCRTTGQVQETRQVDNWVPCTTCDATGKITCTPCSGTGLVTCPTCQGQGNLTCSTCEGQGKLMLEVVVTRHLRASLAKVVFNDPAMDDSAVPLLKHADFTTAIDQLHPCFTPDMVATAKPEEFCKRLKLSIGNLQTPVTDNNKIHHTRLRVHYSMIDVLDYQFDRRRYRAWFLGSDKRIHCPDSPATQSVKDKAELALKFWSDWDILEALPTYRQCLKMAKKDAACRAELASFKKAHPSKLYFMAKHGYTMLGIFAAALVAGFFVLIL